MIKKSKKQAEFEEFVSTYKPIIELPPYANYQSIVQQPRIEDLVDKTKITINPYEPRNFNEFIGQESVKDVLEIIVDSANKEKRLIPNILLTGAYGHGKTTLAKLVAKRHNKKIEILDAAVAGAIITPSKDKIYIIDEAHNLASQLTDTYNILIDTDNLRIIACTTNPGALSAPFRSRFRLLYLVDYTVEDIKRIIQKAAYRAKIKITPKGAEILAQRSKLNPRNALSMLDFTREVMSLTNSKSIGPDEVAYATAKLGIDSLGLNTLDRKYLKLLSNKPIGLQYISAALAVDIDTILYEVEPYLIQEGLIERTAKGRLLVDKKVKEFTEILLKYQQERSRN